MKNIKNLIVTAVFLTVGLVSQAQVAHISSEELVASMPETKAMADALKVMGTNFDTEYNAQAGSLQAKLKLYQEEAATKTDAQNEKRQIEVAELQQKLQLYLSSAREEIQKEEFNKLKPIIDKAKAAIQTVASQKGIKYVMDSSPGKGLIVFDGEDLLPAVKAHLGM